MMQREAAERVRLAMETLCSEQGRYCEQPLTRIADVAGISVRDAVWVLRRLADTKRIHLPQIPDSVDDPFLALLPGAPWPAEPKAGD